MQEIQNRKFGQKIDLDEYVSYSGRGRGDVEVEPNLFKFEEIRVSLNAKIRFQPGPKSYAQRNRPIRTQNCNIVYITSF